MKAVATKSATKRTNNGAMPDSSANEVASIPVITIKQAVSIGRTRRMKETVFRAADFLADAGLGKTIVERSKGATIFSQGDAADAVFYIQKGKVKIAVVSAQGKEATVAVLGVGDFVGEDCIATTHPLRLLTATAQSDCTLLKIGNSSNTTAPSRSTAHC